MTGSLGHVSDTTAGWLLRDLLDLVEVPRTGGQRNCTHLQQDMTEPLNPSSYAVSDYHILG